MFSQVSGGSKGGRRGHAPPPGSKFLQFHAVFGKIRQIRMLAPPLGSWRPLLGEILDPPLQVFVCPQGGGVWLPSMHHRSHDQGASTLLPVGRPWGVRPTTPTPMLAPCGILRDTVNKRAVRILLECILVIYSQ